MIGNIRQILKYILLNWSSDANYEIKKKTPKTLRSYAQNRYYFWVIIKTISQFNWYTPVETHELIKVTFWVETTTNLTTDEFSFMCNAIRDLWYQQYWCYIPSPNEIEELKTLEQYLF